MQIDMAMLQTALIAAFSAGGVYAVIRAELKFMLHEIIRLEKQEIARIERSATRAHDRLDEHLTDYHRNRPNGQA
jgi:hypothetical protein